jgi:hypothetical protein
MKCLSWLASKTAPTDGNKAPTIDSRAPNMMFFESSKRYYWGSIDDIILKQRKSQNLSGIYIYAPGNSKISATEQTTSVNIGNLTFKAPDIMREFSSIHKLEIVKNVDAMSNLQTGYLASVYHELDVTKRQHTEYVYDHVKEHPFFTHTSEQSKGFFADLTSREPYNHQIVGFRHREVHTGVTKNLNDTARSIMSARTSLLNDLEQIKMKIEVAGRTDIEVGGIIYVQYPTAGERTETDKNKSIWDQYYSGIYLITAIHHRITQQHH